MRSSTPSEQSEYWEDRYEENFSNQEDTSTTRFNNTIAQREQSDDVRHNGTRIERASTYSEPTDTNFLSTEPLHTSGSNGN
jgi:hypothetical protein